jgi:carboxymethylenebutenolidase
VTLVTAAGETVAEDIWIDDRRVAVVRPVAEGPWPGVVMLHEIFGLDDIVHRQAQGLASVGYLVYVPDLLGEGLKIVCMRALFRALASQTGRPFEVVEATRRELLRRPDSNGKAGVIGFCLGGGFALLLASRGFDASSVNYGMVPKDLDEVLAGACPIVASYGERDRLFAEVPRLEAGLVEHGIDHDVKTYPTAGHAFLNDADSGPALLRPLMKIAHVGPDPLASADAWQRIEAFFATHLR